MPPFWHDEPHLEGSGLFLHLNTNKKSLTVDLKMEAGRKVVLDLVREADILVENFAPGTMASWGLDYASLSRLNPRLVMTSISNFGQTGPYRDYKMTEITLYALGSTMQVTGMPDRPPLKLGLTVENFYRRHGFGYRDHGRFHGRRPQRRGAVRRPGAHGDSGCQPGPRRAGP